MLAYFFAGVPLHCILDTSLPSGADRRGGFLCHQCKQLCRSKKHSGYSFCPVCFFKMLSYLSEFNVAPVGRQRSPGHKISDIYYANRFDTSQIIRSFHTASLGLSKTKKSYCQLVDNIEALKWSFASIHEWSQSNWKMCYSNYGWFHILVVTKNSILISVINIISEKVVILYYILFWRVRKP